MKKALSIFVDSDAFVALAKEDDTNHEKALALLHVLIEKAVMFVTSNYVFSESVTVISMRKGHMAAIEYIDALHSPHSQFDIKRADHQIEETAIHIFKEQSSKNISYVDCTNIAFVRHFNIDAIFSFDGVYRKNNVPVVEDVISS